MLIGSAIGSCDLAPGGRYGLAISEVDRMLIFYNDRDKVLNAMSRITGDDQLLGRTGLPNVRAWGDLASRVIPAGSAHETILQLIRGGSLSDPHTSMTSLNVMAKLKQKASNSPSKELSRLTVHPSLNADARHDQGHERCRGQGQPRGSVRAAPPRPGDKGGRK